MAEDMTQALWDMLPEQYKTADAEQLPDAYPLRRWLEGPGSIMTRVREFADMAEDGGLTHVDTTNLLTERIDGHTVSVTSKTFRYSDPITLVQDDGEPAVEMIESGNSNGTYFDTTKNWTIADVQPGQWLAMSADVRLVGDWGPPPTVLSITAYSGAVRSAIEEIGNPVNGYDYTRVTRVAQVVSLPEGGYFRTIIYPPTGSVPVGKGFRARRLIAAVGDTKEEALAKVREWRDVPAQALPWLARMLGIDPSPNTPAEIRAAVLSRVRGSAPYIGTRTHIGNAAGRILGSNAPLGVFPHPTDPWVIVVASDVQSIADAGGLQEVWKQLTRLSVAPAGFYIIPMEARVTWDEFDAAKPPVWEVFDQKNQTWNKVDSIGVAFD